MKYEKLFDEAHRYRRAIEEARYVFPNGDRMRRFPRGCCDDATDLFAQYLYDEHKLTTTRIDGGFYPDDSEDRDWHTWLMVDDVVVDLTADQYRQYRDIYIGKYDEFHQRYEVEETVYRGYRDLASSCWHRMDTLYNEIRKYL